MVRNRHSNATAPSSSKSRRTHTTAGFDPTVPSLGVYGQPGVPGEPVTVIDIGEGSITDGAITPGGLNGDHLITPGTLTVTPFADTVRPIVLVTGNPTLPDPLYPIGAFIYNTALTPPRLFKNEGDVWVAPISAVDIQADTITAGEIHAGAIGASEIAAGAVRADHLMVGGMSGFLDNPDFEIGATYVVNVIPGWGTIPVGAGYAQLLDATALGFAMHSGKQCLHITNDATSAYTSVYLQRYVPVGAGDFTLSYWYYYAGASAILHCYDKDGAWLTQLTGGVGTVSGAWTYQRDVFAPPAGTAYVRPGFQHSIVNGGTFIDDVSVMRSSVSIDSTGITVTNGMINVTNAIVNGVVEEVANSTADVVIDSTGITISNGALTIQDEYGSSVMAAAGFSGSWADFISDGLYNSAFELGANGTHPLGRVGQLPYWTLSTLSGTSTVAMTANSSWPGGRYLSFKTSALNGTLRVASDKVSVQGGQRYGCSMTLAKAVNNISTQWGVYVTFEWYNAGGSSLGTSTAVSCAETLAASTTPTLVLGPDVVAPMAARSGRVYVDLKENWTHDATNEIRLGAVTFSPAATAVAASNIRAGFKDITGAGTATATQVVGFDPPLSVAPIVVVTVYADTGVFIATAHTVTYNGFYFNVFRRDGANWSNTINVSWIAIVGQASGV